MQLLQAKRREKEHEHYKSKYVSKWIPRLHAKTFLGLTITFLLLTRNEINEKRKRLEIWCCVVFALFLSENFPRRAENQRLRWCCCREATWKPGSGNRDTRRQDRKRYLCFSHRNQSQKSFVSVARYIAHTHVLFFLLVPTIPFLLNFLIQNKVYIWTHAWKLLYSRCVRQTFSTIRTKPGLIGLYSCTCS